MDLSPLILQAVIHKYSLRSLMIAVTLVCVGLGGVMGRVEYLRRWAEFHDAEAKRFIARQKLVVERENATYIYNAIRSANGKGFDSDLNNGFIRHCVLVHVYRKAMRQPWLMVDETKSIGDADDFTPVSVSK